MTGQDATRSSPDDPLARLDAGRRAVFAAVASELIPAAHGMPSAGEVVGDARLRFVLGARPDLLEPLLAALRPELGDDTGGRIATLGRDEPGVLAALQLVVVGGYYTDREVRERIGYPGQEARQVVAWKVPEYLEEGLIDTVLARGQTWRDPGTGRRRGGTAARPAWRAELDGDAPA